MAWIICGVIAWSVLLYLVDWERFKSATWKVGAIAVLIQLTVDWGGTQLGLYKVTGALIPLFGSSLFFTFGHVFAVTVIFSQYYPRDRVLQPVYVVVWAVLALIEEINLVQYGALVYLNWGHFYSLFVNVIALVFIAWAGRLMGALGENERLI